MNEELNFDWDQFESVYDISALRNVIPEPEIVEENIPTGFFMSANEDEYCLDLLDVIKGQILSVSDDTDLATLTKGQLEKYKVALVCMNKHINSTLERIESLKAAKELNNAGYTTFEELKKISDLLFRK